MNAPQPALSRREFIRVTTLTGGGFLLSLALPGEAWAQPAQALDDTEHQMLPFIEKFRSIKEAVAKFGRI